MFDEYSKDNPAILSAIPEAARLMDPDLFRMLEVTGRDTDPSFIEELECRYGEVPALKLAIKLTENTNTLWRSSAQIRNDHSDRLNSDDLHRLRVNALEMAKYTVVATHMTRDESSVRSIDLHGFLEASDWRNKEEPDYEGNGVCVGIFGAYRD